MFRIKLIFCSSPTSELLRVDCSSYGSAPLISVRGKTNGAYSTAGTFQWSSAVRATACLFLTAKLQQDLRQEEPMLVGEAHSLAASLDYALSKRPNWLLDMFGVSAAGTPLATRLFRVTNSNRKRGGPVAISLNVQSCPPVCIEVVLDGETVDAPAVLNNMIHQIKSYTPPHRGSCATDTLLYEERAHDFIPSER